MSRHLSVRIARLSGDGMMHLRIKAHAHKIPANTEWHNFSRLRVAILHQLPRIIITGSGERTDLPSTNPVASQANASTFLMRETHSYRTVPLGIAGSTNLRGELSGVIHG